MSDIDSHKTLDRPLFEQLFKKHFARMCHFAQQYVGDADSAQDIVQKVFIRLWESREKIDPQQSIQSYLYTVVRSRCLNHIRDHKKYRSQILDLDAADFNVVPPEEEGLEELQQKIQEALAKLPEKCRQVFEMSRFQGLKYKEIAEELEVSQKTVEAHMSKALKTLRECLHTYRFWWWLVCWIF